MLRWPSTARRAALLLVAGLSVGGLARLTAQQATDSGSTAGASTAPVSTPAAPLPGPRVQPEYRRYQASIADSSAAGASGMERDHVIVLSTLSLILIVVIIVLLVTR